MITRRLPTICGFLADLLNNIRRDCEFTYPKLTDSVKFVLERFNSYYISNFKVCEGQMKLLSASLCLSGKDVFLMRFDEIITIILTRIREKTYSTTALYIINELLATYYDKYSDAWATILDRTESILIQIFPDGRKNVLGCDDGVDEVMKILETVSKKLPRFCYNEIVKKLTRQCNHNQVHLDNFPWDRANIAIQTFLFLCTDITKENSVWREEYAKVKIGDLEFEPISREISELIKSIFTKITRQYWQPHLNEFIFNLSRVKLISFIKIALEKFLCLVDGEIVLNLCESNSCEIRELAKESFKLKNFDGSFKTEMLIHKIGNMIFGQTFAISEDQETEDICVSPDDHTTSCSVYAFFKMSFDRNCKIIPNPPDNLEDNLILRGGIFYILESLASWSQTKLSDPNVKLDSKEIELFCKIVDIYFKLLSKYEGLIKRVYLEKQNDKNIILRSWSSIVGFKRNSKEIIDFLTSLIGYSDEKLRSGMIESFKNIPINRIYEFMKLFETFRLSVSEDFVNLKRNRRNDKSKIEITRLYKNILNNVKSEDNSSISSLRMILRHLTELYYFISKFEIIDEFLWKLRCEFCSLLKEYLRIINGGNKKSLLPLKFHLEVWSTIDEWRDIVEKNNNQCGYCNHNDNLKNRNCSQSEEIDELLVYFSYNLVTAIIAVDKDTLPIFIDKLIVRIERVRSDLKPRYVYNLLKSTIEIKEFKLLFTKFVEFIGSGRDESDGKVKEGILDLLKEVEPDILKGSSSLELFQMMLDDYDISATTNSNTTITLHDLEGILKMFYTVSSAKLQRKFLSKLKIFFDTSIVCVINERIIEILFELTGKLIETFPNSLTGLWTSILKHCDGQCIEVIVRFLQDCLQNNQEDFIITLCVFIHEAIYCDKFEMLWLKYSHPFSGVKRRYKYSPVQATLKLLKYTDANPEVKVLFILSPIINGASVDSEDCFELMNVNSDDCYELMRWAVQCPVSKISLAAWKKLKKYVDIVTDDFIRALLKETRRFLQHLVCPATMNYFDPNLVEEVLEFFSLYLQTKQIQVNDVILDDIYELATVQLSTRDCAVFEMSCSIIRASCLQCGHSVDNPLLYYELSKRPSVSIDLLLELFDRNQVINYELYSCYLVSFLPYLFRLFEEDLNILSRPKGSFDYLAEFEYLKQLRLMNGKLLIEDAQVDENGKLCLLELGQFYLSIEKRKKRQSVDFYKTLAGLLSDKSFTNQVNKLIFGSMEISLEWDQFLLYYFDSLRAQKHVISGFKNETFAIANLMCYFIDIDFKDNENAIIRQRVIDYLAA